MTWLKSLSTKRYATPEGFSCADCQRPKRCCDFTPFIPNFLVGFGVATSIPAKEIFRGMELERLHPLGALPSMDMAKNAFCDFYAQGRCLNWEARPAECASYFCNEKIESTVGKHKISTFQKHSQDNFEFEFLKAQQALKHMGHSLKQISAWVDEWNGWVHHRTPMKNTWRLNREARLEFYVEQWTWIQTAFIDLSNERCQFSPS